MKNLELLDLENISGGVNWYMVGKYIFSIIITAELLYLQYQVTYLPEDSHDSHECIYMSLQQFDSLRIFNIFCSALKDAVY